MNLTVSSLRVLFVDDEAPIREVMRNELPRMGHDVTICEDGESALVALAEGVFDAAIVDLKMPGLSGWDVVEHLAEVSPETAVIIHTGHADMQSAIRAVRERAADFLTKPSTLVEIDQALSRVAERRTLNRRNLALETRLKAVQGGTDLVAETPLMRQIVALVDRVAPTDSSVMLLGDTGTGKELVARRIHERSSRASMPFVPINCGALPEHLVESEFFGHRKWAFTGAEDARTGMFEVADGGTLFLDEIGDLDRAMQVKLLRFLESGEIRRIGENQPIHVDVRVVCATNGDLAEMVRDGTFREDLYFRINTFEIQLPPLRERKADIGPLAQVLLARFLKRADVPDDILDPETLEHLVAYDWPGNVRELANALEHAVIMAGDEPIRPEHLPGGLTGGTGVAVLAFRLPDRPKTLRHVEELMIRHVLARHDGQKPAAAVELGISLKTLYNKLKQYSDRDDLRTADGQVTAAR